MKIPPYMVVKKKPVKLRSVRKNLAGKVQKLRLLKSENQPVVFSWILRSLEAPWPMKTLKAKRKKERKDSEWER